MHSTPSGTKNDIQKIQLMFDGVPFEGYVRKDNSLLIADVWRYGIDDDLPLVKENQTPSIKRKIYREVDFQRHAKKLYYDALRAAQ